MNNLTKKILKISILLFLTFSFSCTKNNIKYKDVSKSPTKNPKYEIFSSLSYSNNGIPIFGKKKNKIPGKYNQQFYLVFFDDTNRIIKSFDMINLDKEKQKETSLSIIYKWTGKGFNSGLDLAGKVANSGLRINSNSNSAGAVVSIVIMSGASIVGGSIIGFSKGVYERIKNKMDEPSNLKENIIVMGYREFEYDKIGRLLKISLFAPIKEKNKLFETKVEYYKNSKKIKKVITINIVKEKREKFLSIRQRRGL